MFEKFLVLLTRLGRKNLRIGIRDYWDAGKFLFFRNTPMRLLKSRKLIGVSQLHEIAKRTRRPVEIYTWMRDEYGTSDGAGFEEIGLIIKPDATAEELAKALEHMKEYVSCFELCGPKGGFDHDPIKA